ncbi:hypothetical protein DRO58_03095 [Candidatus Bathyarchaeota archaeon]|nr:MAG: hypothetical protein DRO58_03095 [Candidatus Bathyarchaeota archaeon]
MGDAPILLDTGYLLPLFGVSVDLEMFDELFPRLLEEFEVLYNPVSLVEGKWIALKIAFRQPFLKDRLLKAYRLGLKSLLSDDRLKQTELTSPEIEEVADILLEKGVRDYFDRVVYATAVVHEATLLTEDRELKRLGEAEEAPKPRGVMNWCEVRRLLI